MSVLKAVALALLVAAPALADATSEAREHFKNGQTHYALGEFEEAAKEYREAYRFRAEPVILFNIGQACRQIRQWQQAYFYYRQYLSKKPDAPNREETESLIEQMRRRMDEEEEQRLRVPRDPAAARNDESELPLSKLYGGETAARPPSAGAPTSPAPKPAASTAPAPKPAAPTSPAPIPAPPKSMAAAALVPKPDAVPASGNAPAAAVVRPAAPSASEPARAVPAAAIAPAPSPMAESRSMLRVAGYAALGAGVVGEGLALLFHGSAQSAANEFNQKHSAGTLSTADASLKSDAESKGRLATVAAIGGALLLATGGVLSFAF